MTEYDDEMIDMQADDDDRPDDMPPPDCDPAAERMAAHLDELDAAADWHPGGGWNDGFAASYDEWNATRAATGQEPGTYSEYLEAIGGHLADMRRSQEATARGLGWIK